MAHLFSVATFNDRHEVVWKPDTTDNVRVPVSSDGYCYTRLDTFIYFKDKDLVHRSNIERAAIVLLLWGIMKMNYRYSETKGIFELVR